MYAVTKLNDLLFITKMKNFFHTCSYTCNKRNLTKALIKNRKYKFKNAFRFLSFSYYFSCYYPKILNESDTMIIVPDQGFAFSFTLDQKWTDFEKIMLVLFLFAQKDKTLQR